MQEDGSVDDAPAQGRAARPRPARGRRLTVAALVLAPIASAAPPRTRLYLRRRRVRPDPGFGARTKKATWSTAGSSPTCAGSRSATRSTSPTASPARCPTANTSAARGCHVEHSDHLNGLAVDIVPLNGDGHCDPTWRAITRLAHWAEPRQNQPRPPFRWVGYDGDAGHGCGNHLHLSWMHAPAPPSELAEWVEIFPVSFDRRSSAQRRARPRAPHRPPAGSRPSAPAASQPAATEGRAGCWGPLWVPNHRHVRPSGAFLGCGVDAPSRAAPRPRA